jgi:beta-glucosidase
MFDPPDRVPFASIPIDVVDCPEHRALALQAARESIVLLKNKDGLLPLRKDLSKILVVGPNAASVEVLLGNYNGLNPRMVTVMEGVMGKIGPATAVKCKPGCTIAGPEEGGFFYATIGAAEVDVIVAVLGLAQSLEGEEGVAFQSRTRGDRDDLALPGRQLALLKRLHAIGRPLVLVVASGSPLDLTWAQENVDAILTMWYPGEEGGTAVADVLFGDYNPAGRLPVTFVKSTDQLPPFDDYAMAGRTYRYMDEEPLYPFGYGQSYTVFRYSGLTLSSREVAAGQDVMVTATVENAGQSAGDEVAQLYLSDVEASVSVPCWRLVGFKRIRLEPGEKRTVSFRLTAEQMTLVNEEGERVLEPGRFRLFLGGRQPDGKSEQLTEQAVLSAEFDVTGAPLPFPC